MRTRRYYVMPAERGSDILCMLMPHNVGFVPLFSIYFFGSFGLLPFPAATPFDRVLPPHCTGTTNPRSSFFLSLSLSFSLFLSISFSFFLSLSFFYLNHLAKINPEVVAPSRSDRRVSFDEDHRSSRRREIREFFLASFSSQ